MVNPLVILCVAVLLAIAVIDAQKGMIPDALSIPFVLIALLNAFITDSAIFLPALIGGGFFALQWLVSRGKWVGSADIIVAIGIGLLLGDVMRVIVAFGVAYAIGAIVALTLLLLKIVHRKSRIPFIPFLATGTVVALYW